MDNIRFLQYIGARYVPKFYVNSQNPDSSEWEPNVDYEYMTWVSLPNGAMYLSKEDVPASVGSPVSNPRYWMTAGQFNAYIQQLQTEINDMQDGTVTGSLQNQIDTMQDGTAPGSLQNQINVLDTWAKDRTLRDKQIAVYSDSYGSTGNAFAMAWINALTNYSGHTVHNVSTSGNTMNMIYLSFDNYVADVYIIVGGLNDWNNTADLSAFQAAISNMVTAIRTVKPDAEILFMTPPIAKHAADSGITVYYPLEFYRQAMWQICEELHVMVCSGLSIDNLVMESDGIHPTVSSAPNIADALIRSYEAGGDTRDYHDEYIQNWNNTIILKCIGGQAYLDVERTMNFTTGSASETLDWLNNSKCVYYPKAYGWRRETGGVFQWLLTTNATGIAVIAQRQQNEDSSGVTGQIGIYTGDVPLSLKGLCTVNS